MQIEFLTQVAQLKEFTKKGPRMLPYRLSKGSIVRFYLLNIQDGLFLIAITSDFGF